MHLLRLIWKFWICTSIEVYIQPQFIELNVQEATQSCRHLRYSRSTYCWVWFIQFPPDGRPIGGSTLTPSLFKTTGDSLCLPINKSCKTNLRTSAGNANSLLDPTTSLICFALSVNGSRRWPIKTTLAPVSTIPSYQSFLKVVYVLAMGVDTINWIFYRFTSFSTIHKCIVHKMYYLYS